MDQGSEENHTTVEQGETVSKAEYDKLMAKVSKMEEEAFKNRDAKRKAREESQKALQEQGHFKELAASLEKDKSTLLANLEETQGMLSSVQSAAQKWQAYEKAETARIVEQAENLTEDEKAILDAIPDITKRGQALNRFLSSHEPPKAPPGIPSAAPSQTSNGDDFQSLLDQGLTIGEIQSRHPDTWAAYADAKLASFQGARPKTMVDRFRK